VGASQGDDRAADEARPKDWSGGGLTWRMLAASGLLALILGGTFFVLLLAISIGDAADRRTSHSQAVIAVASRLERLLLDLETGQRGFILTGQPRFLQPWQAARAAFPDLAVALHGLAAGDRTQAPLAARITRDERAYIDQYSVPLVDAARRGEPVARSVATTEAGKRRVDALRVEFDRLTGNERRASAQSLARARSAIRVAYIGAAAGIGGSIALIALYAGYLTRAIVRPVRRSALMAGRLAGGDFSVRLPETGVAEIGALERAFNVMGSSLEQSRDELAEIANEQAALRRVATLVAQAAPSALLFAAVAKEVGRLLPADAASLGRYEPGGRATIVAAWSATGDAALIGFWGSPGGRNLTTRVLETRRPTRVDSYTEEGEVAAPVRKLGIRSAVAVPVSVEGRLWGVMGVASTRDEPLPAGTEARLAGFTELVATAIANAEAQAELRASRARIVATADETRRRIERDLHDGAQQRLVSLALQLRVAQAAVPPGLGGLDAELSRVVAGLTSTLDELREYARGIHPAILAKGGLGPALKALARRSSVPVELDMRARARLPERIEVGAYYVVSEALTNAAKHADASQVTICVEDIDGVLRVVVRDEGRGGADITRGSGLAGLKDRVDALGGRIHVESPPGAGTSVQAEFPFSGDDTGVDDDAAEP
jgi:signal transduction histidine kinase